MSRLARAAMMLVVMLSSFIAPASGQVPAKPPTAGKAAPDPLKGLAREYDKMRGITWYQSPTSPKHANSNGFYLYFGKEDSGRLLPLRLVMRYYADDWLFVKRAWAKADATNVEIPQESGQLFGWERDNSGGKIWEWSDAELRNPAAIAAVRKIAEAKSVTVRFEGRQYYNDRTLSAQQLKAMRDMIGVYEAVSGKPWR